jgi:hypothetical protein
MNLQRADTLDDLAQAHVDRGTLARLMERPQQAEVYIAQGEAYLQDAFKVVPKSHGLVQGTGFPPIKEPEHAYWAMLGKLHRERAIWRFGMAKRAEPNSDEQYRLLDESGRNFALATIYLQHYWPASALLSVVLQAASRRIRQLEPHQRRRVRTAVGQVAEEYRMDVSALLDVIGEVEGGTGPLKSNPLGRGGSQTTPAQTDLISQICAAVFLP